MCRSDCFKISVKSLHVATYSEENKYRGFGCTLDRVDLLIGVITLWLGAAPSLINQCTSVSIIWAPTEACMDAIFNSYAAYAI